MNKLNVIGSVDDVYSHLRNKFVYVGFTQMTLLQRIIDRATYFFLTQKKRHSQNIEVVISEQVVEYPLIMSSINGNNLRILDFGGFESMLPLQLSAIGHKVTVLDQRKYPFIHPNISVCCEDIFNAKFTTNQLFDLIISVSTIEHLGLGHYGDVVKDDADKTAVHALWSQLVRTGKMLITLPAGRPTVQRGYRVYNEERIRDICPDDADVTIRWFSKNGRHGSWSEVDSVSIDNLIYQKPLSQCPVDAVAFVKCEKKP